MRRFVAGPIMVGILLFHGGVVCAQSSLQTLQDELKEAREAHIETTSKALETFFSQVDPAMASADAAVALYQQAGGVLPDPSPVIKQNENETATEKQTRLAIDQANVARLAAILQLQCGMLHYAALFITKPDQDGLKGQWVAWLKTAAQDYPVAVNVPNGPAAPAPHDNGDSDQHHRRKDGAPKPGAPFSPSEIKGKALKDSIISKYLAFNSWGDKEQGSWAVKDLPKLYRSNVLEPLRATPNTTTLAAWDAYIAMANADEKDDDRWAREIYPPLQFDRACDDYSATPSTEKLETLVNMIKANPTNPHADDWITRVSGLMDDYTAKHGGAPGTSPATTATPTNSPTPGVTVTTVQQGDATIITTHNNTNSAPVTH